MGVSSVPFRNAFHVLTEMTQHILNPIFERSTADDDWQRDNRGQFFKPLSYFVSCSCGWWYVSASKTIVEDAWIYHIKTINNPE